MVKLLIFNIDFMEFTKALPDKHYDVTITDPPYGLGENNKKNISRSVNSTKWTRAKPIDYGEFDWDDKKATDEQITECLRVSKNQVIFGGNHFVLPPSSGWIVWNKMTGGDFSDCELAWTSYKRGIRIFHYLWSGFRKEKPEKRFHPTQKPLELMEWVVLNYSKPGDTIFDPFMGSGTTGVACVLAGRSFVGCEKDPVYYKAAQKRIKAAEQQIPLFGG